MSVPVFVKADRRRLKQVLINLLSNAIKYNSQRGTVAVTCEVLAAEQISVCVEDTGAGLSAERLSSCFSPLIVLGKKLLLNKAPASAWS